MCRFVAYIGEKPILLSELLSKPENSLINQSRKAKKDIHYVNADGFGLAWYDKEISPEAGIFKSTQPAWNNSNLKHIANKVKSNCFLGHVRASTVGDVTLNNCHPFAYKEYTFVHNGTVNHFEKIRRPLINQLEDQFFDQIKAQTDSEHLFFLIMQFLSQDPNHDLEQAMLKAFQWLVNAQKKDNEEHFSRLNIVLTDGEQLIATRFVSKEQEPFSLHYAIGNSIGDKASDETIIASEPLTDYGQGWQEVPTNHYLIKKPKTPLTSKAFNIH